ncbi:MAG: hypothetical protein BGO26_04785 [Actinobacteria bacterium 69-20]|jgi:hypothetical protein|nr:SAM-dependent methyltransferase [Actinomycetota bacterium]OJV26912.1 MAG: hypothetical protein BGO26_04785 [Actinobacteria bacterium 69-20]
MSLAGRRVDASWLTLRADEDARARSDFAAGLADRLAAYARATVADRPLRLVDVGAGTGGGAAWLRHRLLPRLPFPQEWRLVDIDGDLLDRAPAVRGGWAHAIVSDIADTAALLDEKPADVITCQALLDLLTPDQLRQLLMPAMGAGAAVLLALTVTGTVRLTSPDDDDDLVADLFNAHQLRAGRLGSDASQRAGELLRRNGYDVVSVHTPWRLGPATGALLEQWLRGRAAAAEEQQPDDGDRIEQWLNRRLDLAHSGALTAIVDHVDLLGLPPAVLGASPR